MQCVRADLDDPRVRALIEHHLRTARAATAACSAHALEVDELKAPDIEVWAVWDGEVLLGVGALKRLARDHSEIKSMHTESGRRRSGVGSAILLHLIARARAAGIARLSLETGSSDYFIPARAFYKGHGFIECPPFGSYVLDPNSVFMCRYLDTPSHLTEAELDDLVRRFDLLTLTKPEWTHAAHLAVGLWHVSRYGPDDALTRLRRGIRRLNESHGTLNTETGGYHETVTRAYAQLLAAFAERHAAEPVAGRLARLYAGPLAGRQVLLRFYSRARLESTEARLDWVEPDVAPLALDGL